MAFVPDAQQPDAGDAAPSKFVPDTPHRSQNLGIVGAPADNPSMQGDAEPSLSKYISGLVDLGATGVQNIPHGIAHAAVDVARHLGAGDPNAPDPKFVQALQAHMLPQTEPVAQAVADTGAAQNLSRLSQSAKGVLQQDLGVQPWAVDDAMRLAPALNPAERLSELGAKLAAMPARGAAAADAFSQAGLRTAEDHPIAQALAGKSGKDALTVQNQQVANVIAANDAGHPVDVPMTPESMAAAREAPSSVYGRAAAALPDAPLSANAANKINAIDQRPVTVTMPDAQTSIGALKTSLLDGSPRTGQQVISDLRALRQKGYANVGSESVAEQEIGKAQLDAADALEMHIQDTLPPDADVSMDQLAAARQQMAKNFTVQGVLKGGDVDLGALARIRRANPQLMTGGLKLLADFADQNPAITGVASKMYEPPSLAKDMTGIKLDEPASYFKALGTGPIARRILTGSQADALAKAQSAFPAYDASRFAPLTPQAPTAPNWTLGSGTSPSSTPPPSTSDLAGILSEAPAGSISYGHGPLPPRTEIPESPPQEESTGIPGLDRALAQLSKRVQGRQLPAAPSSPTIMALGAPVEQPLPQGLSLSPMGDTQAPGIPFRADPGLMSGDLKLADTHQALGQIAQNLRDHAAVMSQGVPDGGMTLAPSQPRTVSLNDILHMDSNPLTLEPTEGPGFAARQNDLFGHTPAEHAAAAKAQDVSDRLRALAAKMRSDGGQQQAFDEGGSVESSAPASAPDPGDLTNQYNTKLTPDQEAAFQKWVAPLGNRGSSYDYDMRGAWLTGAQQAANGHFPDTFKKPNHPTFSDQSQYSTQQTPGGHWDQLPDKSWQFTTSPFQTKYHDPEDLQRYWARVEPSNRLVISGTQQSPPEMAAAAPSSAPVAADPRIKALQDKLPLFASGGSVSDSGSQSTPGVPQGEIQALQQLPPAVLSVMGLNRVANLQVPAMQMPAYAHGGHIPHELHALINRVARLPRRSST